MAINKKMTDGTLRLDGGFSLVELLIAIVVSSFMMIAVYVTYTRQQRVYTAQDQVVETQQNLRAALTIMSYELRMAGYDPQRAGFGVTAATASTFAFTSDLDEDGVLDGGESFSYSLNGTDLRRTSAGAALAENITNLEFCYHLEDVSGCTTAPTTDQIEDIRGVTVSILARSARPDPDYTDTRTFTTAGGSAWGPANDNYHRRFSRITVQCRNLGL